MSELVVFLPTENDRPFLIYDSLTGEISESFFNTNADQDHRFFNREAKAVIPMNRLSVATIELPGTYKQKKKALPYSLEKYIIGDLSAIQFFVSDFSVNEVLAYWTDKGWLVSVLEKLKNSGLFVVGVSAHPRLVAAADGSYLCMKGDPGFFLVRKDGFFWNLDESGYVINRLHKTEKPFFLTSCDPRSHELLGSLPHTHHEFPWWRVSFYENDNWLMLRSLKKFLTKKGWRDKLVEYSRRLLVSSGIVFFCSLFFLSYGLISSYHYERKIKTLTTSTCNIVHAGCVSEKLRLLKHKFGMVDSSDFLPMMAILQRAYKVGSLPAVHHIKYGNGILKIYYSGKILPEYGIKIVDSLFSQAGYLVDSAEEKGFFVLVIHYD